MNPGTLVLVGCVFATGAIVYQGTMAGASTSPPVAVEELARGTATPVPTRTPTAGWINVTPTPSVVAYPTVTLDLDQVRDLPRPQQPANPVSSGSGSTGGSRPQPVATSTPTPPPASAAPASPSPSQPPVETEVPQATPTPAPVWPTPTPTPSVDWWDLPTPPPLPPPPDIHAGQRPPSEG